MNKVILMGRLTRDPDVRYTQGDTPMCIARYTLAVDRRFNRNAAGDGNSADFIPCVVFGKSAEFTEKYLRKGTKVAVTGRIQTGSYTNREGVKVYTTEVIVEDQEFAESKNAASGSNYGGNGAGNYGGGRDGNSYNGGNNYGNSSYNSGSGYNSAGSFDSGAGQASQSSAPAADSLDGFMNIPDGIDEELPFA